MNRSPMPQRRAPLARGTGLSRGTGLERDAAAVRRVPLRAGTRNGPAAEVRALVLERDGYACVCCGRSIAGERYSLAHRRRASQGGKAVPENLIVLLGLGGEAHHGRVDLYRDPEDAVKGYRLSSRQDPATVPVAYVVPDGLEWFLLLPDGSREAAAAPGEAGAV